ncbi:MAG TPA: metallophosphoesterase [Sphingomicrobium sp.]|nr:metallophosphoesterase [Sphingomicrobium sp.]
MGAVVARALGRLIGVLLIALAALLSFTPAEAARQPERIIAVGDLHGDYQAWLDIARAAGIIDPAGHWAGGRTTLVQLGDIVDREPDSLQIIRSLQQLQAEAPRAGGRVVVVLGNHEAMNLLGDDRYTTPGEYAAFADERSPARREQLYISLRQKLEAANPKAPPSQVRDVWMAQHPLGWVEHRQAWSPSGELGTWAARNPAVVKIGGTLFVHGGLSAEYSKLSLDEINGRVAAAMASADNGPSTILYDPLGPLWYRGLVMRDADAEEVRTRESPRPKPLTVDQELDTVLSAYGAQRMVIGHTPDLKGIEFLSGGRLARIDTGNSRYYGGPLSWLEIVGRMIPHSVGRSTP